MQAGYEDVKTLMKDTLLETVKFNLQKAISKIEVFIASVATRGRTVVLECDRTSNCTAIVKHLATSLARQNFKSGTITPGGNDDNL